MNRRSLLIMMMMLLLVFTLPGLGWAAEETAIDTGDTTFVLLSSALVLLMTPGLALFYAGMVRSKNSLGTLMQSMVCMGLISVQWVLFGYSLSFGPDFNHIIGNLDWIGLKGVGVDAAPLAGTIPHQAFMLFQLTFAIITPALISGAIAERMRFPAYVLFILLWATFIYNPVAHWVWGGGWIGAMGALDFAGGTVVHISSGVSALVAALVLGKRKGYGSEPMPPHHLPFTVLGAALLWFGWFGFNGGSALAAGGLATIAYVTTNTAAAAAALSWVLVEWMQHGKPTVLGFVSGAVAGLVAITPAAGFVTPLAALFIGLVGGVVCYLAVSQLKAKLGYDDSLDVFGIHGVGGTWGAIATGIFACSDVNPLGNGLLYGNPSQLVTQLIAVGATYALAIVGTFVILKVIGLFCKLRASDIEEETGLDITQHGEQAYIGM